MSLAPTRADLLILGGGCAGLSLAARLARHPDSPRVHVFETRQQYENDRTWCFWAPTRHAWSDLVSRRWDAWRFSTGAISAEHEPVADLSYQSIPADAFAHAICERIEADPRITLHLGAQVEHLRDGGHEVVVDTDAGPHVAPWVVDTRPPRDTPPVGFAQRFAGAEIETDAPRFDPGSAGLMLDMESDRHGFRFTYLLPFTDRRALIEETRFGLPIADTLLHSALEATIDEVTRGTGHRLLRKEEGCIPMSTRVAQGDTTARVVPAGLHRGAARPSTGYAFLRIQRWADLCAASVARGTGPVPHPPEPVWRSLVDRLFLDVLETRPRLAPELFMAMASGVRPETLVRFLSDDARPRDFARVAAALPKGPFLRQLLDLPRRRGR